MTLSVRAPADTRRPIEQFEDFCQCDGSCFWCVLPVVLFPLAGLAFAVGVIVCAVRGCLA